MYSAEGTVIMPSMSPPSSGTVVSLVGGLESVALLTPPPGTPPSSPSPSPPRASLALRFFRERSLPIGPGLYSLVSTGSISGSWRGGEDFTLLSEKRFKDVIKMSAVV